MFFNDQGDSRDNGIGKDESDEEKDYGGGGGGGERDLHVFSLVMVMRVASKIKRVMVSVMISWHKMKRAKYEGNMESSLLMTK